MDPHIYAVNDFAKFSRIYRNELPLRRYNPREMGMHVALQLIYRHFHPELDRLAPSQVARSLRGLTVSSTAPDHGAQQPAKRSVSGQPVVRFSLPRSFYSVLPFDLTFFHGTMPDPALHIGTTDYLTDSLAAHAHRIGKPPPQRITSLKLSGLGIVSTLCYLGYEPIEFRNLSLLPGKHEAYLNAAVHAHEKGHVTDWIIFFRETWTTTLYLESFHYLLQAIRRNLVSDKGMITLFSRIFERAETLDDDGDLSDFRRNIIGPHGEHVAEVTMKSVETTTMDFLRENADFLPHFYLKSSKEAGRNNDPQTR